MLQNLSPRGIRVTQYNFSQAQHRQARVDHVPCVVRDRQLDLPADEALIDELAAAEPSERSPGVYRLDHASGAHDDRVVATALVAHAIIERAPVGPTSSSAAQLSRVRSSPLGRPAAPSAAPTTRWKSILRTRQDRGPTDEWRLKWRST